VDLRRTSRTIADSATENNLVTFSPRWSLLNAMPIAPATPSATHNEASAQGCGAASGGGAFYGRDVNSPGGAQMFFATLIGAPILAGLVAGVWTLVAGALTFLLYIETMATDRDGINVAGVIFFALVFGGPWVAGRLIRQRRLREQSLEREKANAEAALIEERSRIARELHDIVAHSISVMLLQARGGRRVLDTDPATRARPSA
jgi:signal transduction histidine kinase